MNPQAGQPTSFNVPQSPYQQVPGGTGGQYMPVAPGLQPQLSSQMMSPVTSMPPVMQPPVPVAAPSGSDPSIQTEISAPAGAVPQDEDGGVLDQEWVEKAKDIIARTHADPYAQSQEIGRLKAQYIKARYNKDIKIIED